MREFQVDGGESAQRLDEFLATKLPWLSRMRIGAAIRSGQCLVNGSPAAGGTKLKRGDRVEIAMDFDAPTAMRPEALPVEVLYEDADLAVVVKPAGMLVYPTLREKTGTLANALSWRWNPFLVDPESRSESRLVIRPGFVHRLDRLTSGVMVVAKNPASLRALGFSFAHRKVEKRYLAIVRGEPGRQEFEIEAPIGRIAETRPQWQVVSGSKPATTRVKVLEHRSGKSLLELEPVTGRTNQLRIHCAHAGHPIAGDPHYGGPSASRLCLHATSLAFRHPVSRDWLQFESPMPEEMAAIWDDPSDFL